MKNPERAAALLAELRGLAENDFERHRISVLERDLTAPPNIEQVDETRQKFNGEIYRKNKGGHYTRPASIHRDVWSYYHGEIPKEHDIHHVDEDKNNNDVSNLQCLSKSQHRSVHNKNLTPVEYTCQFCGKIFTSNKTDNNVQFCSKTCYNKWAHRKKTEVRICVICGNSFTISKYSPTLTCSLSCRSQLILKNASVQPIEKICPACGKKFFTHSAKRKYCSPVCGKTAKIKSPVEITCPVCGKIFTQNRKHTDHLCCSRSCGLKLSWQKRRNQN
ncbi:MAG: HNH endonuclease [Selenomonadaceae bacterium]|nr:HNH endonuclease [Selenomonadaceae bacterium]